MIPYDPTRDALIRPYLRDTVFEPGGTYSDLQIGLEAARLAYYPAERDPAQALSLNAALQHIGFNEPTWFEDKETDSQGFGAYRASDHTALLAFRGTEPDKAGDIGTDIKFWKAPWHDSHSLVHHGFADAANGLLNRSTLLHWIEQQNGARLLITGHSLGAAIATLVASLRPPHTLVLAGAPRVGNDEFNKGIKADKIHRLVNCCDIITRIPPVALGFAEVGTQTYIDANGKVHNGLPRGDAAIDADRSAARLAYLRDQAWLSGNVLVRDLADHAPINYIRPFF
jgi:Lipase (class 3)